MNPQILCAWIMIGVGYSTIHLSDAVKFAKDITGKKIALPGLPKVGVMSALSFGTDGKIEFHIWGKSAAGLTSILAVVQMKSEKAGGLMSSKAVPDSLDEEACHVFLNGVAHEKAVCSSVVEALANHSPDAAETYELTGTSQKLKDLVTKLREVKKLTVASVTWDIVASATLDASKTENVQKVIFIEKQKTATTANSVLVVVKRDAEDKAFVAEKASAIRGGKLLIGSFATSVRPAEISKALNALLPTTN